MNLCIIPARGGSKGVPKKNIFPILGKPLISYTIEAALHSKLVDKIIVTSDSEEILNSANHYQSVDLHFRPKILATDNSPIDDTVREIIKDEKYSVFNTIVLLQPTAPIRTGGQIDDAIKLLIATSEAKTLVSVCKMEDVHPARMYSISQTKILTPIIAEYERKRRQDLPDVYYRNGSIYIVRTVDFIQSGRIIMSPAVAFEMSYSQLLNIDDKRDIVIAESLIKAWQNGII